jgi:hypothetical protein
MPRALVLLRWDLRPGDGRHPGRTLAGWITSSTSSIAPSPRPTSVSTRWPDGTTSTI